jgi:hypothetical protein
LAPQILRVLAVNGFFAIPAEIVARLPENPQLAMAGAGLNANSKLPWVDECAASPGARPDIQKTQDTIS